jgi:hypothetical protein
MKTQKFELVPKSDKYGPLEVLLIETATRKLTLLLHVETIACPSFSSCADILVVGGQSFKIQCGQCLFSFTDSIAGELGGSVIPTALANLIELSFPSFTYYYCPAKLVTQKMATMQYERSSDRGGSYVLLDE